MKLSYNEMQKSKTFSDKKIKNYVIRTAEAAYNVITV